NMPVCHNDHGKDRVLAQVVEVALDLGADPHREERGARPHIDRAEGGGGDKTDLLQRHLSAYGTSGGMAWRRRFLPGQGNLKSLKYQSALVYQSTATVTTSVPPTR